MTTPMLAAALLLTGAGAADAATITVTTTADTSAGQCTLRDAITAANTDAVTGACAAGSGTDVIALGGVSGTITLGSALPSLFTPMSLQGPGASVLSVDGAATYRIFNVAASTAGISALRITNGGCTDGCGVLNNGTLAMDAVRLDHNVASATGGTNTFPEAGAIENNATVTLTNSLVDANSAVGTGGTSQNGPAGGAIYNGASAMLTIDRTTVQGNSAIASAGAGGSTNAVGGAVDNVGVLHVIRSTFSGNAATGSGSTTNNSANGGAIVNGNSATVNVTIDRSTIAGNSATASGTGSNSASAGAFNVFGTSFAVTSSTITGNSAATSANVALSAVATLRSTIISNPQGGGTNCGAFGGTSQGFNITDGTGCGFTQSTDLLSTDPLLDAGGLANNGGPTQTIALLAGSPAIDHGLASVGETTDQRGFARPSDVAAIVNAVGGDGSDTGAFEVQAPVTSGGSGPMSTPPPPIVDPPVPTAPSSAPLACGRMPSLSGRTRQGAVKYLAIDGCSVTATFVTKDRARKGFRRIRVTVQSIKAGTPIFPPGGHVTLTMTPVRDAR